MAITNAGNTPLTFTNLPIGIQVTKITDTSADWASVANSTYFYDKGDRLVHFKNSAGTVLEIFSAGGFTNFTEAQATTSPNNTVYVDSLTASGSVTDIDIAIVPKGAGAFMLQVPNNAASGGDKRGSRAIDLQLNRANSDQVASGNNAIVIGSGNKASGTNSIAIGSFSQANNTNSIAIGKQASTSALIGRMAFCNEPVAIDGDCQKSTFILKGQTSDATPLILSTNNLTADYSNQVLMNSDSAYRFKGTIIGKQTASLNTAAWDIDGLMSVAGVFSATTLHVANVNLVQNTPAWGTPALSVYFNNVFSVGGLQVQVTGAATTNIQWTAVIETTEVRYF